MTKRHSEQTDSFLYFAYGSNMLTRRLRERVPSAVVAGGGYCTCRRLTFDKVSKDGSGKCDIEPTSCPTDHISSAEEMKLDLAEGFGKGYRKETIAVVTPSATSKVMAYVATIKEPVLRPYHWYKALVVAGAVEHNLPVPYIEWLRTFESWPDPNVDRRSENEALLFGG
jgi:gamma-glutamylcyclotransferase